MIKNKVLSLMLITALLPSIAFSRYIRGEATYDPANFVKLKREISKENNITGYECKNPNAPDTDKIYVMHYMSKRR
jgi:hypothetical protein